MESTPHPEWSRPPGSSDDTPGRSTAALERDDTAGPQPEVKTGEAMQSDQLSPTQLPAALAGAVSMLLAEGERLLEQLHTQEGDVLLNTMLRSSTPASRALKSRVNTPQTADCADESGGTAEILATHNQTVDQLIVEADELATHLPDEDIRELLTAIERGSSPVAQAVRSRVHTPAANASTGNMQEYGSSFIPPLDVDRTRLQSTTDSVFSLLTERTRLNLSALESEGTFLIEQLDETSRSSIADTLAHQVLSPSRPIASLLVSILLQVGSDKVDLSGVSDDDTARLQDLLDDAGYILAAIYEAIASGAQTEQRTAMLARLQEMAGQGGGNFVARMLYFDMMVSCRTISESGHTDGSISERSRGQFAELVEQGANLIDNLEQQHARSVLDSITSGAATNR